MNEWVNDELFQINCLTKSVFPHWIQRIGFIKRNIKVNVSDRSGGHFSLKTHKYWQKLDINMFYHELYQPCMGMHMYSRSASAYSCLQVFADVQAYPVAVWVRDKTQPHVCSGVVEVTQQVDRLRASFRAQKSVQLLRADHLIRWGLRDGCPDRQTKCKSDYWPQVCNYSGLKTAVMQQQQEQSNTVE